MQLRQIRLAAAVFLLCVAALTIKAHTDIFARNFSPKAETKTFNAKNVLKRRFSERDLRQDFAEALDIIKNFHVDGAQKDFAELGANAVRGTLRALDPHSSFFDAREYNELQDGHHSSYVGIGAPIADFRRGNVTETYITSVAPNSPAFRAGLRFGDKIIKIDGELCAGKGVLAVREKIRGTRDSVVRLMLERASTNRIETVELRRAEVFAPSLPDAYLLHEDIGYIDLTEGFSLTTADELRLALNALHNAGARRLILDLRGNVGGIVSQAIKTASYFLPNGKVILSQKGRNPFDTAVFRSDERQPENASLIVLVDGRTASAAEIVAGALQDHDRALIVGETTFGKGLVQSLIPIDDGAALTLTTARYFTPSGRSIQRDYENVSNYEYFTSRSAWKNRRVENTLTEGGRKVFGGNGIAPDVYLTAEKFSDERRKTDDAVFAFVRELVNGKIAGLENFRVTRPNLKGYRLTKDDLVISEKVFEAFGKFASEYGFSGVRSVSNKSEISFRLRYFLAVANFGITTAKQILIEHDRQILHSLELFPQAREIANLNRRVFKNR